VTSDRHATHGWCSLRLRFDAREQALLRGAEQVRGASMAHTTRPEVLRTALLLAKAGHKVAAAAPGASVSLDEGELALLVDAVRYASEEVKLATRVQDGHDRARYEAVMAGFPELVEKGTWRGFGLVRELEALAGRLTTALKS
jgi:hypothetical protein